MVRIEILQKRISKAYEYLEILKKIKKEYSKEIFVKDPLIYGSTERFLQLTIEALIDIGNHIVSDQNLGQVNFYSDIPQLLYQNNYIKKDLKEIFIQIIGFRNILVHDYLNIDLSIVYSVLNEKLDDLFSILKEYSKFL